MSKMTLIQAMAKIDRKGLFSFAAITTVKSVKKSRTTGKPTPENLLNVTKYSAFTVSLGNDYENAVNSRLVKEGSEPNFEAGKTYCFPVDSQKMIFEHKSSGQKYLRVYTGLAASFKSVARYFDADGIEITSQWESLRAEYFDKPSENKNQGLDKPVFPLNYKIEGVVYLKQGDFEWSEIPNDIKKLLAG
jgi:hypothetical protein